MGNFVDYYEILGLTQKATTLDITNAFRAKVLEIRPDLHTDLETRMRFEEVQKARDVLSDQFRRKLYDMDYEINAWIGGLNYLASEAKKLSQEIESVENAFKRNY